MGEKSFDGGDFAAWRRHGKQRARFHRLAIEQNRTCSANGGFAADVRAREPEHVAQIMNQKQARLDLALIRFAVHTKLDFHGASDSTKKTGGTNVTPAALRFQVMQNSQT